VVMICRNRSKGEQAQTEIKQKTGNASVDLIVGDMGSLKDVRQMARQFSERYKRLDVLVNNAGVNLGTFQLTEEGHEATLAINHLGTFLLTNLLLNLLKASAPSRVVTVSSSAHKMGKVQFEDLEYKKKYKAFGAYAQSKLANLLFSNELAKKLEGTGVTSNAADPGGVATNLGSDQLLFRILVKLPIGFKTPERGAATAIQLATAPELEKVTGKYFSNGKEAKPSKLGSDPALAQRLWQVTAEMCELKQ
jgi:NAD(P)-dependent dehydrogenase (short-subunit alcohol dehydrogenase family)